MSPAASTLRCHRCLQPVLPGARRCPHCGDYLKTGIRKVSIILAIIGAFLLLALVGFGVYLAPSGDGDDDNTEQQAPPPKPEKKPPLN